MNNRGEDGQRRIKTADQKIFEAERLIKNGNRGAIYAWNILLELKQQKCKLTNPQNKKVAKLMDSISVKKNLEIEEGLKKLQQSIEKKNIAIAAGTLGFLATNYMFLTIKQKSSLIPLKNIFLEDSGLKSIEDIEYIKNECDKKTEKISEAAKTLENAQKLIDNEKDEEAKKILSFALNGILSRSERAKILRLLDEIAIRSNGRKTKNRMR